MHSHNYNSDSKCTNLYKVEVRVDKIRQSLLKQQKELIGEREENRNSSVIQQTTCTEWHRNKHEQCHHSPNSYDPEKI